MHRREICTLVGIGLLAGCAENTDTNAASGDTAAEERGESGGEYTGDEIPDDEHLTIFEEFLQTNGVTVQALTLDVNTVTLEYMTDSVTDEEIAAEIGLIAGGFFRALTEGFSAERLESEIQTADESPQATWYAVREWYDEFEDGERTDDELSLEVLETLESV